MRTALASLRSLLTLSLALILSAPSLSCDPGSRGKQPLFTHPAPQSEPFKLELQYLVTKGRLSESDRKLIEQDLAHLESELAVPKSLLWCVLFQESRFDAFKNAFSSSLAKGMGQFTPSALAEINLDTDHFDLRTGRVLASVLAPKALPLDFKVKTKPKIKKAGYRTRQLPEQVTTSYFNSRTAVFASGAYLNNRYYQLKRALDRQGVTYSPEVLWLYAAAAYNKGSRTVFVLLTHLYMKRGERGLSSLLQDPMQSMALLSHEDLLNDSLKDFWRKRRRVKYLDELSRNMEVISSCVSPENPS